MEKFNKYFKINESDNNFIDPFGEEDWDDDMVDDGVGYRIFKNERGGFSFNVNIKEYGDYLIQQNPKMVNIKEDPNFWCGLALGKKLRDLEITHNRG